MKRTLIIVCIIIAAVVGAVAITYFYQYQGEHYVATDDAQVKADTVTVSPQLTGAIDTWNVAVGDTVTAGQILGTQETDTAKASMNLPAQASAQPSAQPGNSNASGAGASSTPTPSESPEDKLTERAQIKSPINGKVILVNAVKGQIVAPGTSLAVIQNTANTYVLANIKEVNINDIAINQKVDVTFDAFPGKTYDGKVANIGQATQSVFSLLPASNASGSYTKVTQLIPVQISIKNDDNDNLMPGMNATVKITIK